MSDVYQIDLESVLKERAPKTKLPRFVLNLLKKIAHQDDLNDFFIRYPDVDGENFMKSAFEFLNITTRVIGKENFPHGGKYIFVSNHPLGGIDGVALGYELSKEYKGKIKFFSNDLLSTLGPLKTMFIPVNKLGMQSRESALIMDQIYSSDDHLFSFPAGMCSRKVDGEICDLEWKKNFVTKAIQYQRDVVPIYFDGKNSKFFYNLARIRKLLGIKFNVEMMFLADEMFKQRGSTFTLHIGKPISWETFDKSKTHLEWAQHVKTLVYNIKH